MHKFDRMFVSDGEAMTSNECHLVRQILITLVIGPIGKLQQDSKQLVLHRVRGF